MLKIIRNNALRVFICNSSDISNNRKLLIINCNQIIVFVNHLS